MSLSLSLSLGRCLPPSLPSFLSPNILLSRRDDSYGWTVGWWKGRGGGGGRVVGLGDYPGFGREDGGQGGVGEMAGLGWVCVVLCWWKRG